MRNDLKLAAFCVQRRSIAASVLIGTHLGYVDAKQLPSDHGKAEIAAVGFVNWIIESLEIDTAVLEDFEGDVTHLKTQLFLATERTLRSCAISLQTVPTAELLTAFAYPTKATRKDVRQIITTIWPILDTKTVHPAKLDAVALGLYYQTERLLQ